MSGTINGLGAFHIRATAPAAESQYARIVELVRTAQASKAPLQRLADEYAVWFTPITLAVCAIAVAVDTRLDARARDSRRRNAVSADSRHAGGDHRRHQSGRAKRSIIVRHGGALEQLSRSHSRGVRQDGNDHVGKPGSQHGERGARLRRATT